MADQDRPMLRGSVAALAAAFCFGATVPAVQYFSRAVGPWSTAALLYVGALVAAMPIGRRNPAEKTLGRAQVPRLVTVAVLGAALAPALLAMGLRRIDGASASLLLDFEAAFTVLLARALYREAISRRVVIALFVMTSGGVALLGPALAAPRLAVGSVEVLGAVLCWALDSALTRPLADFEPTRVVRGKSLIGVALTAGVAVVMRERLPTVVDAVGLLACGAVGYGLGLRLYLRAQRFVGAARTASVFAAAPFFGAAVAVLAGSRGQGWPSLAGAGGLLAVGTYLLATERHDHAHTHEALEHTHAHRHDDGHHDHTHHHDHTDADADADAPAHAPAHAHAHAGADAHADAHAETHGGAAGATAEGEHTHKHRHEAVAHTHPHADDDHHRHDH